MVQEIQLTGVSRRTHGGRLGARGAGGRLRLRGPCRMDALPGRWVRGPGHRLLLPKGNELTSLLDQER